MQQRKIHTPDTFYETKIPADCNSSVGQNKDRPDQSINTTSKIEGPVKATVGVEPNEQGSHRSELVISTSADKHLAVQLNCHTKNRHILVLAGRESCAGIKRRVAGSVGV